MNVFQSGLKYNSLKLKENLIKVRRRVKNKPEACQKQIKKKMAATKT